METGIDLLNKVTKDLTKYASFADLVNDKEFSPALVMRGGLSRETTFADVYDMTMCQRNDERRVVRL